jgi:hypothetical protein
MLTTPKPDKSHTLYGRIDPALDRAQEVDPVDRGATLEG